MRHLVGLSLVALLAAAGAANAGLPCLGCQTDCRPIPCQDCPDCNSCPCDHRLPVTLFGPCHAQKFIEELGTGDCCERIKAVKKLGCRLHADFCSDPCVLTALLNALHCDPCYEVREAAAWSLVGQNARVEQAILSLYIQSKIDPHYLVRTKSAEALDILTLCHRPCYKGLYEQGDAIVKALKAAKYKPGQPGCQAILAGVCGGCGAPVAAPPMGEPVKPPMTPPKTEAEAGPQRLPPALGQPSLR
jgi:hypothetical protein